LGKALSGYGYAVFYEPVGLAHGGKRKLICKEAARGLAGMTAEFHGS
jgi:hypothetical protein